MKIVVAFELDERERKAIGLSYKQKGLADKNYCTLWVTSVVELALESVVEEAHMIRLDEIDKRALKKAGKKGRRR